MKGRSILITGVTGKAVLPLAAALAVDNEVFGQARFSDGFAERRVAAHGIRPCPADLALGDWDRLPKAVDYVLHFAWTRAPADQLAHAMKVNVEGAGLLLHRYRNARAALVVSSSAVYRGVADPLYRYAESDPLGAGPTVAAETSAICKIALETIARSAARAFGPPLTIARLNTVLGPHRAFYGKQVEAVLAGREIVLPGEHNAHNPIHSEDMIRHIEPLLDAAGREAPTINWSGDDIAVSQAAIARIAERTGRTARIAVRSAPGLAGGTVTDTARRISITGPCTVSFTAGFEAMLDEMLDGRRSRHAQRDWGYGSPWQNRIYQ